MHYTPTQLVIPPATPHTHHMRTEKDSSPTISDSLVSKPIIGTAPIKNNTMEIV